jgi:hypothetical protein
MPPASLPGPSAGGSSPARPANANNGNASSWPSPGVPAPAPNAPIAAPVSFGPPQSPIGGDPQVESYDEETYNAKTNDTFRAISQQFYHTDQYERALLLFNRNHPLATNALQQDGSVLPAGQPIYIPPARILEKYYGAPVSHSAPPVSPSGLPTRAVNRTDAAGSVPLASASVGSPGTPVKPTSSSTSVPLYRVREGGEMLIEIAHRTLDNGDRWADIYRLNPRFDPKEVVPAGSLLRLPRDARVDPRDMP